MEVCIQVHIPSLNISRSLYIPLRDYWGVQRLEICVGPVSKNAALKKTRNRLDDGPAKVDLHRFARATPSTPPVQRSRVDLLPPLFGDTFAASKSLVMECSAGLENYPPELFSEGSGGVYLLRDASNRPAAIFKPSDEEPGCSANPKANENARVRTGIALGGGAAREVASCALDHGFAGVPTTTLARVYHPTFGPKPKSGSLQKFVRDAQVAENFGPSSFSTADVQRVAALDMRILNTDRHRYVLHTCTWLHKISVLTVLFAAATCSPLVMLTGATRSAWCP